MTAHTTINDDVPIEDAVDLVLNILAKTSTKKTFSFRGIHLALAPDATRQEIVDRFYAQQFNVLSTTYTRQFITPNAAFFKLTRQVLQQITKDFTSLRLFDIGAGTGFVLESIYRPELNLSYTGLDVSQPMLGQLERLHSSKNLCKLETINACAQSYFEKTRTSEPSYDLITCIAALHIIEKAQKDKAKGFGDRGFEVLSRAIQHLRPGGYLIVGNHYHESQADFEVFAEKWHQYQHEQGFETRHQPSPPEQLFTPELMITWCEQVGLSVQKPMAKSITSLGIRGYVLIAKKP